MSSGHEITPAVGGQRRGLLSAAALAWLLAANLVFLYVVVVFEHHHVHAENSLLENLQAAVLAAGSLFYLLALRAGACHALCPALALLGFSFFLREVDVEHLPLPDLLRMLGSGKGKVLLLLALWAVVAVRFWRQMAQGLVSGRSLLRTGMAWVFAVVVGLLLVSFVMDKEYFALEHARLFEELAETNAYLVLVCGGLAAVWASRRKTALAVDTTVDTTAST